MENYWPPSCDSSLENGSRWSLEPGRAPRGGAARSMFVDVLLKLRPVAGKAALEPGRDIPKPSDSTVACRLICRGNGTLNGSDDCEGRRIARGRAAVVGNPAVGEVGSVNGKAAKEVRVGRPCAAAVRGEINGRGSPAIRKGGGPPSPERSRVPGTNLLAGRMPFVPLSIVGSEPDSAVDDIAVPDSVAVTFSNIPDDSESMLGLRTRLRAGRRAVSPLGDEGGEGALSDSRPGRKGGRFTVPIRGGNCPGRPIRRAGGFKGGSTTGAAGGGISPSIDAGRD